MDNTSSKQYKPKKENILKLSKFLKLTEDNNNTQSEKPNEPYPDTATQ